MEAPSPIPNEIFLSEIDESSRVREDYGDLTSLVFSIKEFGLIQPIVVTWDDNRWRLLAGGRRLRALQKLGRQSIIHGKEILVREELYNSEDKNIQYIRQSIELEENLKRKDMTWPEQVEGKRRLLTLMQERFGTRAAGGSTRAEISGSATPEQTGYSLRMLADQLGESAAMTSKDIKLAEMLEFIPQLADVETKTAALRKLETMLAVIEMKNQAKPADAGKPYKLYRGDVLVNIHELADESVDLICTDLPFGTNISQMSHHEGGIGYSDSREEVIELINQLMVEAFRILRSNRYAVFFFGFNYYPQLVDILQMAGFQVNKVPFVWYKGTRSTEDPNSRYGNSYDPALVCMKGAAKFIKPGQPNYLQATPLTNKIQVAQQPIEVPSRFITDMTAENAVVADLTAGTGTTGEAALRLKRYPILFEENNQLCDYIVGRLDGLKL